MGRAAGVEQHLTEHVEALLWGRLRSRGEHLACCGNGVLRIIRIGLGELADHVVQVGRADVWGSGLA